jgi:outer membrane protein OmpA-like peptidoglycan-associated protein
MTRRLITIATTVFLLSVLLAPATWTAQYKYTLGAGGGIVKATGGNFFEYDPEAAIAFSLGHRLADHWYIDFEYSYFKLTNDTAAELTDSIGSLYNNSPLEFRATRLGILFNHWFLDPDRPFNLTAGLGGGLLVWKGVNPEDNTTYEVRGDKNETADFSASELFATASAGLLLKPASHWSLQVAGRADYLTSAGAEFESAVNDARDKLILGATAKLYFHFGAVEPKFEWKSSQTWTESPREEPVVRRDYRERDGDGDGVPDDRDACLNTPHGAEVGSDGCPRDSDRDGVPNGLDDCPDTRPEARGNIDIHGCEVDSDFDGIADFEDQCPFNTPGARVDETGCPIDGDKDGVPDGLDDCPNTLAGVEVDKHGCIDLEMFSQPMVLNIDYPPGSFEVDPHNRDRLRRLAGLLNFVTDIKLDINGYTDNIGTETANRQLSQKRADRVKGLLVAMGVDESRIKTYGRGESNFVASNQTADGRAKNRRIEIVFYR